MTRTDCSHRPKSYGAGCLHWLALLAVAVLQAFAQDVARDNARSAANPQTPAPAVRIVLFTPSDLTMPAGTRQRLTQIADVTEKFLFKEMTCWGYPPAAKSLFRREPDGLVEVLTVRGEQPVSSGKYGKPNYADAVIKQAAGQYQLAAKGQVWWIFVYLGDRPARFATFAGAGNPRDGGWAMVNYDTLPGDITSDLGLAEGFNGQFFLKGTIHELGHAFGLPHVGPDLALGLGNSLMGPTTADYARRNGPKPERVYLSEASAAMLWKHPLFSGTKTENVCLPSVKLVDYKATFESKENRVMISGKLITDQQAHTVVLLDDVGRPKDLYWCQSHAARIGRDGRFQIKITSPAKTTGQYRILFCFESGLVTGDGSNVRFVNRGEIRKSYRFQDDHFQFDD